MFLPPTESISSSNNIKKKWFLSFFRERHHRLRHHRQRHLMKWSEMSETRASGWLQAWQGQAAYENPPLLGRLFLLCSASSSSFAVHSHRWQTYLLGDLVAKMKFQFKIVINFCFESTWWKILLQWKKEKNIITIIIYRPCGKSCRYWNSSSLSSSARALDDGERGGSLGISCRGISPSLFFALFPVAAVSIWPHGTLGRLPLMMA